MSRIARSRPPGVSRRMINPSAPLFAASSMLWTMYSAMGGVMAALIVITSKTGPFSAAAAGSADRMKQRSSTAALTALQILLPGMRTGISSFLSSLPPRSSVSSSFLPEGLHDHLDILPDLFFRPGISEQIGRVVGRHQRNPLIGVEPPPQDADRRLRFQQGMGRKGPQGTDHLRPDRLGAAGSERARRRRSRPAGDCGSREAGTSGCCRCRPPPFSVPSPR